MNDPTCPFCGGNDRDAPCEIERRYLEMIQPYVRLKADIHAKSAVEKIDGILEVIAREMTRKARLKPLTPDQYEENLLQHGIAR